MSPRPRVRVAQRDAYGEVGNRYDAAVSLDDEAPEMPWAVHLTDSRGRYQLLCFDLDGKTPTAAAQARLDGELLTALLSEARMEPVVCDSGGGGLHVWVALSEGVAADVVASLARLVKHLCPTLDTPPLTNPHTGCVRPPGAPHRFGTQSRVISGDVASLMAPTATVTHVNRLLELVAARVQAVQGPAGEESRGALLPVDAHGRLYLAGPRRVLSPAAEAALDQRGPDASGVLWTVLLGAAASRWRYDDVEALLETAPGLEHARTERSGAARRPRGAAASKVLLRRQWNKAVRYVAAHSGEAGTDPSFPARAGAVAETVRRVQSRADSAAGRWSTGGGPTDRRVLDALCILALQAVSATVEADVRRLAVMCGIARETARRALWRLTEGSWVGQVRPAEGPRAAYWTISPTEDVHSSMKTSGSQGFPPPSGRPLLLGPAERTALLASLSSRLASAAQDLFTPSPGLGYRSGNLYARTSFTTPVWVEDLASATGMGWGEVEDLLHGLAVAGVVAPSRAGWTRTSIEAVEAAARMRGVAGRLALREAEYSSERRVWAWWQAELGWLRRRRHDPVTGERKPGRRAGLPSPDALLAPGVEELVRYRYPRTTTGRPDHDAARAAVAGPTVAAAVSQGR